MRSKPRARRRGVFCCPRAGAPVRRPARVPPRGARFLVDIVVVLVCSRVSCGGLFCPARGLVFLWWCGGFLVAVKWHVNDEKKPGKCSAGAGKCPFGADTPHFGTKREAEAAAEELIARESAGFGGEAKASALTECGDGSGLAVDAAGRWYRDGVLVEDMVEAVSDEGEPVMFTDSEFHGSIVSDAGTDVRIHAGRINDLVNVGCYSNYDDGMNMSMIGGDATVERAFGVSVGYVGDDAHVGLLTDHREPGDTSSFATLSQVDDMRDRAVIDVVSGETRIFGMMGESRIVELTGTAGVDEMSGASHIDEVNSWAGVDYMLGDSRIGKVRGRASMLRENSHVRVVHEGGFVEEVHDDSSVKFVSSHGRVKGVYENGRVEIVRYGGSVGSVNGEGAMVVSVGGGGTVESVRDGATVWEVGDYLAPDRATVGSVDESSRIGLIDCGADITFDYADEEDVTPERASVLLAERLRDDSTSVSTVLVSRVRGASYGDPNVTLRVRDGDGNVVEASRLGDILRGLPDVTSVERDEMRRA